MKVNITITSMYGSENRKPLVSFVVEGEQETNLQFSVDEARKVARDLLEAAEAAIQDGFVFEFISKTLGFSEQHAAIFLNEFRKWRNDARL